jgi:gliding motility-associated-like protein
VAPPPTATPVTDPITIISGASATLNMIYTGNITSYSWLPVQNLDCPNCPIPVATPRVTTKYAVQVLDRYGCGDKGEVTVQVVCNGQNYFVPNTFTPNGDGSNDIFYPRGTGVFRISALRVFNRWGELVFEKRDFQVNDASAGWNGTYKGQAAKPDVYVYQLDVFCNNGETVRLNGNIALIR